LLEKASGRIVSVADNSQALQEEKRVLQERLEAVQSPAVRAARRGRKGEGFCTQIGGRTGRDEEAADRCEEGGGRAEA